MMEKQEKVKFSRSVKNHFYILSLVFKIAPGYSIMRLVQGVVSGINHAVSIYLISVLLNTIDRGEGFDKVLYVLGFTVLYYAVYGLFCAYHWKIYNPYHRLDFQKKLHRKFFEKAAELDLAKYDTPEFYNEFVYSMRQSDSSISATLDATGDLIRSLVAGISVFSVCLTVNKVVAVLILGFSILEMLINMAENKIHYKYNLKQNPIWRKEWYIERFFSLSAYAKEIRTSEIGEVMENEYAKTMAEDKKLSVERGVKAAFWQTLGSLLTIIIELFVILYLAYLLFEGSILIGGLTVGLSAIYKLRNAISGIQYTLVNMNKNSLFADKARRFLETENEIKDGTIEIDEFKSIEFKNVSFAYGSENVLNNINFKINKGERIALVGYNGAGKTTLTKLIMRLYDVTEGEILVNGINIKEYKLSSLREKIGAVFQDYRIFATTVAENVLADKYTPDKEEVVINALYDSTFGDKLKKLPNGINTELTREFCTDGTELSGGEAQKIAIARVFAHNNELIIMDEPSSALDPIAEYELNCGIEKNAKDKTVVFITHRLSTTRHVDKIYMIEKGRIIETGSHDDLITIDGKYAEMFNIQAEKYKA